MKGITIPSFLLSQELCLALKLKEQSHIFLIPDSIIKKFNIFSENLNFEVVLVNNKFTLVGPSIQKSVSFTETIV